MFIATRLSLLISAKSEMLSISLFADEVRGDEVSINIPCLRHVLSQFVRAITFEAKPPEVAKLCLTYLIPPKTGSRQLSLDSWVTILRMSYTTKPRLGLNYVRCFARGLAISP